MKLVAFIFLGSIFCLSPNAQQKTDKEIKDLQGNIHVVRSTIFYEVKTGKTVKKGIQSESTETYNQQGNLTEALSIFAQQLAHKTTYSKDAEGNRIEKMAVERLLPRANEPPPPPAPMGSSDDVLEFKTTAKFDSKENRLETITYRKSGELLHTKIYLFDEKGRVIEESQKDGPKVPFGSQYKIQSKRDEKGVVTESINYAKDGTVERRTLYQYVFDARGNWVRRTESLFDKNNKPLTDSFITQRKIAYY